MDVSSILCWAWMDESLEGVFNTISNLSTTFGDASGVAKALAAVIALIVGAGEAYLMMIGRRGIDVMKLLRIVIISVAITYSGQLVGAVRSIFIGNGATMDQGIEGVFKKKLESQETRMIKAYNDVAMKRLTLYSDITELKKKLKETETQAMLDQSLWDKAVGAVKELGEKVFDATVGAISNTIYTIDSAILLLFQKIVSWVAETFYQVAYYGILIGQRIFLCVMGVFFPIVLALSLAPAYRNAWSQWLSRYLSLCLWSVVLFMVMYVINECVIAGLQQDYNALNSLTDEMAHKGGLFAGLEGMLTGLWNNLGSSLFGVVMYFVGFFIIKMIPEVCSWLIPAGMSSGWAHSMGGLTSASALWALSQSYKAGKMIVTSGGSTAADAAAGAAGSMASASNLGGESNLLSSQNFDSSNPQE